ncbi:unnamed protein product [Blepharisma stoltei]|uniref:Uncharacterized protein n=1 Tax=Blepharisma stoltei TaxID=1481888 RepID=A0AAU9JRQ9_9CILI|nr:unnamed protein product [Blepharisma stoltei]
MVSDIFTMDGNEFNRLALLSILSPQHWFIDEACNGKTLWIKSSPVMRENKCIKQLLWIVACLKCQDLKPQLK